MKIKKGFVLRTIGNEQVIIGEGIEQVDFNKIIRLNATGVELWNEMQKGDFTVSTIADFIMANYQGVDEKAATVDAQTFIDRLSQAGLLE